MVEGSPLIPKILMLAFLPLWNLTVALMVEETELSMLDINVHVYLGVSQVYNKIDQSDVIRTVPQTEKQRGLEMAACSLGHGFALTTLRTIADKASTYSSSSSCNGTAIRIKCKGGSIIRRKPLYLPTIISAPHLAANTGSVVRNLRPVSCHGVSTNPSNTTQYEFNDGSSDVELRLLLKGIGVQSSKEIHVDADGSSLVVQRRRPGSISTLMETKQLYGTIKPGETIWKQDPELKWPDIVESWESLSSGVVQLLKGTSVFLVGDSSEINKKVAHELAVGLGYTPLDTKDLLETLAKRSIESWVAAEGPDSVAEAEQAVLESLSSHVRVVVSTLGGQHGAAGWADKWRHLYAGFTVWLSESEAADEDSAKEEAKKQVNDGSLAYSKADVVVKFGAWDANHAKDVAQASLSALKQLILSDKKLPGSVSARLSFSYGYVCGLIPANLECKKSLYVRLGCRGDWPNIKPPGWDPSSGTDASPATL
ncbi:hypothetical protein Cgig2_017801 [Carnegiea gigantea]|uniref:Uncharacterized protein n=1 Tax=Carnegiea gigantea TaxID=171969 RepID=A0A9Q1QT68_9CARY|nr:hypothetical protein Cgig2_017801 [Carnegiea gigantea]